MLIASEKRNQQLRAGGSDMGQRWRLHEVVVQKCNTPLLRKNNQNALKKVSHDFIGSHELTH